MKKKASRESIILSGLSAGDLDMFHLSCFFPGMPINALYTKCRERFLVSNQVTLNSHLTEFKDHELVKVGRHADGQDCLHIPLPSEALGQLLQELG